MAWTIEAKVFDIEAFGITVGNHLYFEVWDENGDRVYQINGHAEKSSGTITPVGEVGDGLKAFYNNHYLNNTINYTKSTSSDAGVIVFEGSQQDVNDIMTDVISAINDINSNTFTYAPTPRYDQHNSNSVFDGILRVIEASNSNVSDDVREALEPHITFSPGVERDIFNGDPNYPEHNAVGYTGQEEITVIEPLSGTDTGTPYVVNAWYKIESTATRGETFDLENPITITHVNGQVTQFDTPVFTSDYQNYVAANDNVGYKKVA